MSTSGTSSAAATVVVFKVLGNEPKMIKAVAVLCHGNAPNKINKSGPAELQTLTTSSVFVPSDYCSHGVARPSSCPARQAALGMVCCRHV